MKSHMESIRKDGKYWTAFLLIGIAFIITGSYSVFYPFAKHVSVARIMGLLALLIGVIRAGSSVKNRQAIAHWHRQVSIGIFNAAIGIFLLSYQGISMLILPFLLSFWVLSGSIALIEEATDINIFHTTDADWMLVGSILTVVAFLVAAYLPILGSITAVLAASIFLIIIGLFYIFLSLRLRVIRKEFLDSEVYLTH
jgi:uncharacterized membrane protein HdeD (DUF308 family)